MWYDWSLFCLKLPTSTRIFFLLPPLRFSKGSGESSPKSGCKSGYPKCAQSWWSNASWIRFAAGFEAGLMTSLSHSLPKQMKLIESFGTEAESYWTLCTKWSTCWLFEFLFLEASSQRTHLIAKKKVLCSSCSTRQQEAPGKNHFDAV